MRSDTKRDRAERDRCPCGGLESGSSAARDSTQAARTAPVPVSQASSCLAWARLQTSSRPTLSSFWAANHLASAYWSSIGGRPDRLSPESIGVLGRQLLMTCGSEGLGWYDASHSALETRVRAESGAGDLARHRAGSLASPGVTQATHAHIAPVPSLRMDAVERIEPLTLLPPVMRLPACCPSVWFQMMGVRNVEPKGGGRVQLRLAFRGLARFRSGGACRCACCRFTQVALRSDVTWSCPGKGQEVERFPHGPPMPHEDCFWLVKLPSGEYLEFPGDRDASAFEAHRKAGLPVYGPYCYGDNSTPFPVDYPGADAAREGNRVSECEVSWRDTPHFGVNTTGRAGCKLIWTFEVSVVISPAAECRGGPKEFRFQMELVASVDGNGDLENEFVRADGHVNPGQWPGGGPR